MREVILALLAKEPAHGYELRHGIESLFGEVWPGVNIGQVHSTLGRLERAGLVRSVAVAQTNRPDKKGVRTHIGRARGAAGLGGRGGGR